MVLKPTHQLFTKLNLRSPLLVKGCGQQIVKTPAATNYGAMATTGHRLRVNQTKK